MWWRKSVNRINKQALIQRTGNKPIHGVEEKRRWRRWRRRSVVTYCCPSLNELTEMSPHLTPLVLGANYFDCETLKRSLCAQRVNKPRESFFFFLRCGRKLSLQVGLRMESALVGRMEERRSGGKRWWRTKEALQRAHFPCWVSSTTSGVERENVTKLKPLHWGSCRVFMS